MTAKKTLLFLCTGNSCRSQMAEGDARALGTGALEVLSAGLEAHGLNPRAVAVRHVTDLLSEAGALR